MEWRRIAMPRKSAGVCRSRGCWQPANASLYCTEHESEGRQPRQYDHRLSSSKRGYGARWRKLRKMQLSRHPLCNDPYGVHGGVRVVATDVDHITPKSKGGKDSLENLQSLCHSCHSLKTARKEGERGASSLYPTLKRPYGGCKKPARDLKHGGD